MSAHRSQPARADARGFLAPAARPSLRAMTSLHAEIDARRDALIALTQDLIRIPTLNPPGRHYRDICDYIEARLAPRAGAAR